MNDARTFNRPDAQARQKAFLQRVFAVETEDRSVPKRFARIAAQKGFGKVGRRNGNIPHGSESGRAGARNGGRFGGHHGDGRSVSQTLERVILIVRAHVKSNPLSSFLRRSGVKREIGQRFRKPGCERIVVDENRDACHTIGLFARAKVGERLRFEKTHRLRAPKKFFARGRGHGRYGAAHEHGAQPVFEPLDALGKRRRRDAEAPRRPFKTALFDHGQKGFELRMEKRHDGFPFLKTLVLLHLLNLFSFYCMREDR